MKTRLLLLSAVLALTACGPQPESNSSGGTRLFDTQRDALDKAKTVNDTVTQGSQALRAQEEAQSK
jgi:outer membrane biogenesis lipoprotein LolB